MYYYGELSELQKKKIEVKKLNKKEQGTNHLFLLLEFSPV